MKVSKLLFAIFILPVVLCGCNNWLDVSPEDLIKEEDLFASGEGYRNALNGVYKTLSTKDLYGRNLTWGTLDAIGQCYDYEFMENSVSDMKHAAIFEFKYDFVVPVIKAIWENSYNAVANCNNIIKNIENTDPGMFAEKTEKNMIWGEALALRAFIQFDMLKLFAPSRENAKGGKYLPYISVYPSLAPKKLTVEECLEHITNDLKAAKALLWKTDSAFDFKDRFDPIGAGDKRFSKTRGYRLNYYAITGILARACLYAGDNAEAYKQAKEIIDFQTKQRKFTYTSSYRMESGNIKAYEDLIAGFYSSKLIDWDREVNEGVSKEERFFLSLLNIEDIYRNDYSIETKNGVKTVKTDDNRLKWQVNYYYYDYWGEYFFRSIKYKDRPGTNYTKVNNNIIPILRMSEIYYIAGEAIYEQNPDEAKGYLGEVKKGRGFGTTAVNNFKASIVSFPTFIDAMVQDARREFVGEGQIFYMYKRLNRPIPGAKNVSYPTDRYVLPIPESEINMN